MRELDVDGPAAPPRVNGELAFTRPWQGRLFATTTALGEAGVIDPAEFRERLIVEVGRRDDAGATGPDDYWAAWQDALEAVLTHRGVVDPTVLTTQAERFAHHH
jgi:nitrile hydratase accessory protein